MYLHAQEVGRHVTMNPVVREFSDFRIDLVPTEGPSGIQSAAGIVWCFTQELARPENTGGSRPERWHSF
ncbi:hypothetical protein RSSM_05319 [Rhodopirellula sallentina SM41]|uniref:Uncharacterized protein n=1 Tax=Rhodopirellula sallentina SM41 TaxID=1263870 RepID=M5U5X9_9BACT|nr:hypothetical protein RSSM_05319 [Rhodopirellula sallentina SM41]